MRLTECELKAEFDLNTIIGGPVSHGVLGQASDTHICNFYFMYILSPVNSCNLDRVQS